MAELAARHDPRHGGFGPAPKFPQTALIELCLRHYRHSDDAHSLEIATNDARCDGGRRDL